MGILDKLNTFGTATAEAGTDTTLTAWGDVLDFTATYGPGGGNQPFWLDVTFTTLGVDATATYIDLVLITDADGTVPTAGQEVARFRVLKADTAVGKHYSFPIGGGKRWLRYVALCTQVDDAYTTHPAFTAALTPNSQSALQ